MNKDAKTRGFPPRTPAKGRLDSPWNPSLLGRRFGRGEAPQHKSPTRRPSADAEESKPQRGSVDGTALRKMWPQCGRAFRNADVRGSKGSRDAPWPGDWGWKTPDIKPMSNK